MHIKVLSIAAISIVMVILLSGCHTLPISSSSKTTSSDLDEEASSSSESNQWTDGYLTAMDDVSSPAFESGFEVGEDAAISIDYFSFESTSDSSYDIGYEEAYNKYYRYSFLRGYIEGYISICDDIDLDCLFEDISNDIYG